MTVKLSSSYKGRIKTHSIKEIYLPYDLSQKATGRCAPSKLGSKPRKRKTWDTENKGAHHKRGEGSLQNDGEIRSQDKS